MMGLPIIEQVELTVRDICMQHPFVDLAQARAMVRVEMDRAGVNALYYASANLDRWTGGQGAPEGGPIKVMGVSYYQVDRLTKSAHEMRVDADHFQLINPFAVRA